MEHSVRTIKKLSLKHRRQLLELFAAADFADLADGMEWLNGAVTGSLVAVGAFDQNDDLIGFARALGDGVSDCYIQDVTVHPVCRKQGIGKELVEFLLAELAEKEIDWVGLIATPGKADFYRKLGFEAMQDHTPMRLKKI